MAAFLKLTDVEGGNIYANFSRVTHFERFFPRSPLAGQERTFVFILNKAPDKALNVTNQPKDIAAQLASNNFVKFIQVTSAETGQPMFYNSHFISNMHRFHPRNPLQGKERTILSLGNLDLEVNETPDQIISLNELDGSVGSKLTGNVLGLIGDVEGFVWGLVEDEDECAFLASEWRTWKETFEVSHPREVGIDVSSFDISKLQKSSHSPINPRTLPVSLLPTLPSSSFRLHQQKPASKCITTLIS